MLCFYLLFCFVFPFKDPYGNNPYNPYGSNSQPSTSSPLAGGRSGNPLVYLFMLFIFCHNYVYVFFLSFYTNNFIQTLMGQSKFHRNRIYSYWDLGIIAFFQYWSLLLYYYFQVFFILYTHAIFILDPYGSGSYPNSGGSGQDQPNYPGAGGGTFFYLTNSRGFPHVPIKWIVIKNSHCYITAKIRHIITNKLISKLN